ncbi:hypothetical protein QE152_g15876 [Popillia japonica]|uniref:Uncharacterized protein n=1 Tax=Popillia japonica TaxID=7064 RepID=A0AAW1L7W0_POPJA
MGRGGKENEDNDLSELDFVNPCDEENSNQNDTISRYYYGKNRFKWSSNPAFVRTTRTLQHNIVLKCPGLKTVSSGLPILPLLELPELCNTTSY